MANEIIAHATAAIRQDPQRGRSLSVVEIGGQDAKFIQISGGQIVESDMNRACSAGTGSFLEEQAKCYGIDDVREFVRRAREARLRRSLADAQGVPAYIVFNDAVLLRLAERRPRTLEEFRTIPGIGPAKEARYGEAFLRALKEIADEK